MPNYKEGFEILKDKLKVALDKTNNFNFINIDLGSYYADSSLLTEEEYNCVKECLDAEPDSIEKIIEDFKKLGYKLNYYQKLTDNALEISFSDKEAFPNKEIYIKAEDKEDVYVYITDDIFIDDLRLVNRVLRVWGLEVC